MNSQVRQGHCPLPAPPAPSTGLCRRAHPPAPRHSMTTIGDNTHAPAIGVHASVASVAAPVKSRRVGGATRGEATPPPPRGWLGEGTPPAVSLGWPGPPKKLLGAATLACACAAQAQSSV